MKNNSIELRVTWMTRVESTCSSMSTCNNNNNNVPTLDDTENYLIGLFVHPHLCDMPHHTHRVELHLMLHITRATTPVLDNLIVTQLAKKFPQSSQQPDTGTSQVRERNQSRRNCEHLVHHLRARAKLVLLRLQVFVYPPVSNRCATSTDLRVTHRRVPRSR